MPLALAALVTGAVALGLLSVSRTFAADAAGPGGQQRQASTEDSAFLQLQAYDLEPVEKQATASLKVGDAFVVRVVGLEQVSGPGYKLEPPKGAEPVTDSGWSVTSAPAVSGGIVQFRLSPVQSGQLTLPSLAIVDPTGAIVGRTNPFSAEVKSVLPPEEKEKSGKQTQDPNDPNQAAKAAGGDDSQGELVPPRPPVELGIPLWLAVLLFACLAAGAYGALRAWKRWRASRRKPEAVVVEPPQPEDVVALADLEALMALGMMKKGQYKPHYFRASEILKRYIGARFDFDASESTTREMIAIMEERRISDALTDRIENLMERMDRVKFADEVPSPEQGAQVCEEIRAFIQSTRRPRATAGPIAGGFAARASQGAGPSLSIVWIAGALLGGFSSRPANAAAVSPDVPMGAWVENNKGLSSFKKGKIEEAQRNFGAAQALNPTLPELQYNQSTVQMESGDLDNAIKGFDSAAEAARKKGDAGLAGRSHFNQGDTYAKKGDIPSAIQSFLKSIDEARAAKDPQLEEDARRNIETLSRRRQQQKQQEKNQDKKQDKDQQNQQGQDQQKKDKGSQDKPNEKSGDKKQDKDQKSGQQDQKDKGQGDQERDKSQPQKYKDPSEGRQRQFRSAKLNKEDAERVMAELSNREKELQARLKKGKGAPQSNGKDW